MRKTHIFSMATLVLVLAFGCDLQREEPVDVAGINDGTDGGSQGGGGQGGGGGGGSGSTTPEQGVAELARFESAQELEDYFKGQILEQNQRFMGFRGLEDGEFLDEAPTAGGDDLAGAADGDSAADASAAPEAGAAQAGDGDFSGTTIQEEGVDEADVVKTDGQYIYVMTGQQLRIVSAQPPDAMQLLASFDLEGYGRDLYLVGDLAVALTSNAGVFLPVGGFGIDAVGLPAGPRQEEPFIGIDGADFIVEPWYRPRPQTVVSVIDVSDRSDPSLVWQTAFDGSISASRMIDGVLRLVLANFPDYYYDVLPLGAEEDELGLPDIDLDVLLPDFVSLGPDGQTRRGNVVEFDGFFRPVDPDGFGVTTIITMDTDTPDQFDAVAVVAEPGLIYASTEALYLTDTDYYFDFRRVNTDIYKFAFTPQSVNLVAAGQVPGRILNQYSMGEYQGFLRVASTTDQLFIWETGEQIPSTNAVYVLGEQDDALAVVGSVEDVAPGEQIQSARFLGDRGYVVTFVQIDPFFTLDLADPLNPRIVGELKLPGFSTFITPMDQDHVLTVGVYVDPDGFGLRE
ncbi:MAG: beta-propeller domain-containing protein, partial [Phycisphaerae bacterium]